MIKIIQEEFHDYGIEPSSVEYGKFMDDARKNKKKFLKDNNIELDILNKGSHTLYTYYCDDPNMNLYYVEAHEHLSHWCKSLMINDQEVDIYKTKKGSIGIAGTNKCSIYTVIDMIKNPDEWDIVYK